MIKTFSYPIPDELYVDSFGEGKSITLSYDGPESITVLVDKNINIISGLNPETYDQDAYNLLTVDAEKQPEICYLLMNPSDTSYEYEYQEEVMENGDVYTKILNPIISDAYDVVYDTENDSLKLELIVKVTESNFVTLNLKSIRNKLNFILSNEEGKKEKNEELYVSEEILSKVTEVANSIDTYIESDRIFMSWKYTNFDTILESLFPIPTEIKDLLNNYK